MVLWMHIAQKIRSYKGKILAIVFQSFSSNTNTAMTTSEVQNFQMQHLQEGNGAQASSFDQRS
jgi:hypothetical protein